MARQCWVAQGEVWRGAAGQGLAAHCRARHGIARRGTALPCKAKFGKATTKGNDMRIGITIEGITPLICNRFTDAAAQAATSGTRGANQGDRGSEREQAEVKLYLTPDGLPCIPQPNLLRCIVDGGSWHKLGKKQITTKKDSLIYSCLDIPGTVIPIEHNQPWAVDVRPVVIPSTGGRILTYRPRFDDWRLTFEIELETNIIGVKLARLIVNDSGTKIGLGDFRPSRKGPFGRFHVVNWQEVPVQLREAAE
jgi:hypothetical protein